MILFLKTNSEFDWYAATEFIKALVQITDYIIKV